MAVNNRHGENILTQSKLGVNAVQLKAIKLMLKNLSKIYRFAGVDNLTKKNSVKDHTYQMLKLSDYITESLDDEADRQALRLVCLLHDFGEIAGELTVVNDDLNGKRVLSSRDKVKIEADVFYIMMNLALDAVKTDNSELFESTLAMLRPIVEEGVSKDS